MKKLFHKISSIMLISTLVVGLFVSPIYANEIATNEKCTENKNGATISTERNFEDLKEYLNCFPNEEVEIVEEEPGTYVTRNASTGDIVLKSKKVSEVMYVTADNGLNVRNIPTVDSKRYNIIENKTELIRVGFSECGWDIVSIDGKQFFVWGEYLSNEKPESGVVVYEDFAEEDYYEEETANSPRLYEPSEFQWMGVLNWGGYRWTYYSQQVLPGGGLNIPGRHVDEDGYVCDENGYICLASNDLSRGIVVPTPLGKDGKIYDSGCASGTLDVYVNW